MASSGAFAEGSAKSTSGAVGTKAAGTVSPPISDRPGARGLLRGEEGRMTVRDSPPSSPQDSTAP
ncbi:hypothetical protein, partial [Staphylococcus aureus]